MSPELEQGLRARYPRVFKGPQPKSPFLRAGVSLDIGDGWHNLLDTACELLYSRYSQALDLYRHLRKREGQPTYTGSGEVVTAVEVEKARLAAAAEAERIPYAIQIKEKFGGLRFYTSEGSPVQDAYIAFAEALSTRTCDVCGALGTQGGSGWVRTRCSQHEA